MNLLTKQSLLKLAALSVCLVWLTLLGTGCGVVPISDPEQQTTPEPVAEETISVPIQGLPVQPAETAPLLGQRQPLFDGEKFLLHHSQVMENYEAALAETNIPLSVNWAHEMLGLNVLTYDMKYGDMVAAKVIVSLNPQTAAVQKLYFCDLREENSPNKELSQQQMEAAARLFVSTTHGAMTDDDWKEIETAALRAPFLDDRTKQTRDMMTAQLDDVCVYWEAANWAIAVSSAIDPKSGALLE